jgi:pimeloyl-ACP methyl ester carboxylesterase
VLIARLDVPDVDWVGTSLGGLLGMLLAAQPQTPIRHLVLNDVGAFVPAAVSEYLASYIGQDPTFETPTDLEARLREIYGGEKKFGDLTDAQWRQLAHCSERPKAQGLLGFAFDPKLGNLYVPPFRDVDLWAIWERVRCSVLVLRGENSFVLTEETAERMRTSGPRATVVEIPYCGHAPALMSAEQIATIEEWLKTAEVSKAPRSFLGTARATGAELVGAQ